MLNTFMLFVSTCGDLENSGFPTWLPLKLETNPRNKTPAIPEHFAGLSPLVFPELTFIEGTPLEFGISDTHSLNQRLEDKDDPFGGLFTLHGGDPLVEIGVCLIFHPI